MDLDGCLLPKHKLDCPTYNHVGCGARQKQPEAKGESRLGVLCSKHAWHYLKGHSEVTEGIIVDIFGF